jgi:hypothetical protein
MPRGRRGLLQRAERLARQAADLEEEAKRTEAKAFYLIREADQLEGERAGGASCAVLCRGAAHSSARMPFPSRHWRPYAAIAGASETANLIF